MNETKGVKLIEAKEKDMNLLKNLVSLYLHDLSEFADDLKVNEEGKFEYDCIEYYFKLEELTPLLIYSNNEIDGFVLLNSGKYVPNDVDYSIHELFILKSYRNKGIAGSAVKQVLDKYRGRYKVAQLGKNKLAIGFWKNFFEKSNIEFQEKVEKVDGFECYTQIFNY